MKSLALAVFGIFSVAATSAQADVYKGLVKGGAPGDFIGVNESAEIHYDTLTGKMDVFVYENGKKVYTTRGVPQQHRYTGGDVTEAYTLNAIDEYGNVAIAKLKVARGGVEASIKNIVKR